MTRRMLDAAYPDGRGAGSSTGRPKASAGARTAASRPCSLRHAAKTLADPHLRQIATDALALSRLTLTDDFKPDIEGEYIGFGAVLSWDEGDVTTHLRRPSTSRIRPEYCDHMGEVMIPLGDPGALGAWFQRMGQRFEAIGLIDRLIYALSIETERRRFYHD